MSPTTVIEPDSDRRVSIRSCMGERSCTSSTTMWPYLRTPSSALPFRGPSRCRASSTSAASAGVQATSSKRRRARAVEELLLLGGQHAAGGRLDQRGGAEQVVEQLVGGQPGPHPVERLGQLGHPPHLAGEVLEIELVVRQLGRVLVAGEGGHRGRAYRRPGSAGSGGHGRPAAGPPPARPAGAARCGCRGGGGPRRRSAGCPRRSAGASSAP